MFDIFLNITWIGAGWQILIDVVAKVDMHTYQCFGDFWNAVHNDDAGKGLHYDVSCAYAYQVGQTPFYGSECVSDSNTLLPIVGQSCNFQKQNTFLSDCQINQISASIARVHRASGNDSKTDTINASYTVGYHWIH